MGLSTGFFFFSSSESESFFHYIVLAMGAGVSFLGSVTSGFKNEVESNFFGIGLSSILVTVVDCYS
jgi:hypothetical protein